MRIRETRTENTKKDNKSGGKHHGKESLHCGTVQSNTVHGRCDVVLCNTHAPLPTDILAYILLFVFNLVISGAASSLSYGLQSTSSLLKQNNQKALILV